MDLKGKKVLVVGLGASGRAASLLCLSQGALVRATDNHPSPANAGELAAAGAELSLGGHRDQDFAEAQLIVLSPGVDHRLPEVRKAAEAGVPVIGELELGWRHTRCPSVMITGTNGKSTVTTLLGEILETAGFKTLVGGNLGRPLCDMAPESGQADWAVVEVSSFQTDTMDRLRPRVAAILNISPDHLNRYPDFEAYAASKLRLLANQADDDVAVLCADDKPTWQRRSLAPASLWGYGAVGPYHPGGWLDGEALILETPAGQAALSLGDGTLSNGFNRLNALAACLCAAACGASFEAMQQALDTFSGLAHRLARVGERDGVIFFDDSKGTNVGAVAAALEAMERRVVLLLGGQDKQGRFAELGPLLGRRAARVVCFGEAGPSIYQQVVGFAPAEVAPDLAAGFRLALERALPGEAVLLSPGCASFDAYSGYAQRGEHFQNLVEEVCRG
ncbi:MAG: UDP-N-acetylmuramoyl-L-alanine--D-glutamate ligase [Desulfarculaceae bacterium]|nr:UDP-N-acetylmuramoyl-L-alanine--D-glutamate ligase [Desulfarculaceae bacterium]MCF8070905.1 UDP-N-acetylmuramoyl-L-alanine--D-glutamate ligase [Desulfarculaceae bacterium]MCF8100493.1 UDP-N-acetylmuramoyl-L-alanine--D-glutamate ligase [Desulfarculaceae bacterium]MCF8116519.1 UDP-N-acetylmuramoyl-L-alanine--D-glutamate ligase [Desulfarculaceae bacterium]